MNAPTKRQRLAEWIQKQDPYICCLQEIHLETRDTYGLKVKGWKKILHANRDQKQAGVAILISNKMQFKTKAVKRDKGHYTMIRGSIQEDTTIMIIYAPNILEKEMATHSSVLAWRTPGTGEPGGLPSMGSHRVGHD